MSNDRRDGAAQPGNAELKALLASLDNDDLHPPSPPASMWDQIAAQISNDPVTVTDHEPADGARTIDLHSAQQRPTRPRAGFHTRWLAAAAAVVLVIGGAAVWFARRSSSRVVATAQLTYEAGFDPAGETAAASAKLIERDGNYLISLNDSTLPTSLDEPADLELWLIDADPDGNLDVQPVAIIDQGDGTYTIPSGLNPAVHNIVDISIEPRDGDATHSGRSILRGTLVEV